MMIRLDMNIDTGQDGREAEMIAYNENDAYPGRSDEHHQLYKMNMIGRGDIWYKNRMNNTGKPREVCCISMRVA